MRREQMDRAIFYEIHPSMHQIQGLAVMNAPASHLSLDTDEIQKEIWIIKWLFSGLFKKTINHTSVSQRLISKAPTPRKCVQIVIVCQIAQQSGCYESS